MIKKKDKNLHIIFFSRFDFHCQNQHSFLRSLVTHMFESTSSQVNFEIFIHRSHLVDHVLYIIRIWHVTFTLSFRFRWQNLGWVVINVEVEPDIIIWWCVGGFGFLVFFRTPIYYFDVWTSWRFLNSLRMVQHLTNLKPLACSLWNFSSALFNMVVSFSPICSNC